MVGRVLSHYRVLELIGSGGMGEVYLAEDTHLRRKVALKVLSEEAAANPIRTGRFDREMRAIAAINHPNVVTLYEAIEAEGRRVLAMEWVDGKTLSEYLEQGEKLSLTKFLDLAVPLVSGLHAAHSAGIAHRDLKPGNVMVTRDRRVKLLDFGLASLRAATQREDPELTKTGTVVGTPAYMSPEQLCGHKVGTPADQFALGVLFYELLAGSRPFNGQTPTELASSILRDEPKPLQELRPELPGSLCELVMTCLEKVPDDRLADSGALLEGLEALQLESQVHEITEHVTLVGRRSRRRRVLLGWSVAAAAVVLGVAAGWWWSRSASGPRYEPRVTPVMTWAGLQSDSQRSPDGAWVSFIDSQFGPGQVFLQRVDGGEPRRLSPGAGAAVGHIWSDDGEFVALMVRSGDDTYVQIYHPFGAAAERVLALEPGVYYRRFVRWLGDAIYLEGPNGLSLLELPQGRVTNLIPGELDGAALASFDVDPRGRQVVFTRLMDGAHTWVAAIDGSRSRPLGGFDGSDYYPHFLGAGSDLIAVSAFRGGRQDLWLVPLARPEAAVPLLLGSWDEEIDSSSLHDLTATFRESGRRSDLLLVDPSAQPSEVPLTSGVRRISAASSSANGSLIAYQDSDPRLASTLYPFGSRVVVAPVENSELSAQRTLIGEGAEPKLSGSGERLAYLRRVDGAVQLIVHELETHVETTVAGDFPFAGLLMPTLELPYSGFAWDAAERLAFVDRGERGFRLLLWDAERPRQPIVLAASEERIVGDVVTAGESAFAFPVLGRGASADGSRVEITRVADGAGETGAAWLELEPGQQARLIGWSPRDRPIVVVAELNRDWTNRVHVLELAGADAEELVVIDRTVRSNIVFDRARSRLLYSTKDALSGAFNLYEMSIESSLPRQLTYNRNAGVLYTHLQPLPTGGVLLSRAELVSTINVLQLVPTS